MTEAKLVVKLVVKLEVAEKVPQAEEPKNPVAERLAPMVEKVKSEKGLTWMVRFVNISLSMYPA